MVYDRVRNTGSSLDTEGSAITRSMLRRVFRTGSFVFFNILAVMTATVRLRDASQCRQPLLCIP
jgi:hypothetical protein